MTVGALGEDGVTVTLASAAGEQQAAFGKAMPVSSTFHIHEGVNYTYTVTFSPA